MGGKSKWEYLRAIYRRYREAAAALRGRILDEFCQVCGYHRKYAIRLLNGPPPQKPKAKQKVRSVTYSSAVISILAAVWESAGYPCSSRLKALLPLWLPWARKRFAPTAAQEHQILRISARQMDRRLLARKGQLHRKIYGRTKPGTLLKHHIPLKTDGWDVHTPGFTEVDLVSHSGDCGQGEFIHSLNQTDIHTTWVETHAVLGKGQQRILNALEEMRLALPFKLLGIDSDNGSEFINGQLYRYCQRFQIQFTRGRPYKKNDNAHIEQKNWTHVRKLFGYVRYDSTEILDAMNALYQNELRLFQNLFQPSVKLIKKVRLGSRIKRVYDAPKTPFQRLCESPQSDPAKMAELKTVLSSTNPFELSSRIDQKLEAIYQMAHCKGTLDPSRPKDHPEPNRIKPLTPTKRAKRKEPIF
jgi:hypothetical protein